MGRQQPTAHAGTVKEIRSLGGQADGCTGRELIEGVLPDWATADETDGVDRRPRHRGTFRLVGRRIERRWFHFGGMCGM